VESIFRKFKILYCKFTTLIIKYPKGVDVMRRLFGIFLAFTINTTMTYYLTTEGTWENLLLQCMSLSMIIVFFFYYFQFIKKAKKMT